MNYSSIFPRRNALRMCIALALAFGVAGGVAGCKRMQYVSTHPLDDAGFSYSTIQDLHALDLNDAEVAELARTKSGGVSERACLELLRAARSRKQRFASSADATALHSAGVGDDAIVELMRLNQLGPLTSEAEIIRLGGISDRVILALAHRRAEGKPAISSASLTRLKNAGISEPTLYELTVRGITDADAADLAARRKKGGFNEADVLRSYPAR